MKDKYNIGNLKTRVEEELKSQANNYMIKRSDCGRDRMVVGYTATYATSVYHY